MVNLVWVSTIIDSLASQGKLVGELHMNEVTHNQFVATMLAADPNAHQEGKKVGRKIVKFWRFRGIPLVVNDKIPVNGLLCRPTHLMEDENWLETCLKEMREQAAISVCPVPQREPPREVAALPVSGEVKSSEAIGNATASVSDLLINAATECDDVEVAVVILLRKGEVHVSSNARKFEVYGILQSAACKVYQEIV